MKLPKLLLTHDDYWHFQNSFDHYKEMQQHYNHKTSWVYQKLKSEWLITYDALKHICELLGFKPGWVYHKWEELQEDYERSYGLKWKSVEDRWVLSKHKTRWDEYDHSKLLHLGLVREARELDQRLTQDRQYQHIRNSELTPEQLHALKCQFNSLIQIDATKDHG